MDEEQFGIELAAELREARGFPHTPESKAQNFGAYRSAEIDSLCSDGRTLASLVATVDGLSKNDAETIADSIESGMQEPHRLNLLRRRVKALEERMVTIEDLKGLVTQRQLKEVHEAIEKIEAKDGDSP